MASRLLHTPELKLDSESQDFDGRSEAAYLAQSMKKVADHYASLKLDQKWVDWGNLAMCLGAVYGTRLEAIRMRWQFEAQAQRAMRGPRGVSQPAQTQGPGGTINGQEIPIEPPGAPRDMRTGTVPGVGEVEFPPGHPLAGGKTH